VKINTFEKIAENCIMKGAWECLFLLVKKSLISDITTIKNSNGNTLLEIAEKSGFANEFRLLYTSIIEIQKGKSVDIKLVIENAINETNKNNSSTLLVASDEDCLLHVPLSKTSREKREKQMSNYPETDERLKILVGTPPYGILMNDEYLESDLWLNNCEAAPISDILRVHEYFYIKNLMNTASSTSADTENPSIFLKYHFLRLYWQN